MEVHIAADLESKLAELAAQQGRAPDAVVQEAVKRYIEDETRFLEGVERGIAASQRGEFLEEEEMDARVARLLQS